MNFVEELKWRGMIHQMMPGTEELLQKEQVTAYVGIREKYDTIVIESLGQILRNVVCMVYFQLVEPHKRAPEQYKPNGRY